MVRTTCKAARVLPEERQMGGACTSAWRTCAVLQDNVRGRESGIRRAAVCGRQRLHLWCRDKRGPGAPGGPVGPQRDVQGSRLPVSSAAGPGREGSSAERPPVLQRDGEGATRHGVLLPPGHAPLLLLLPPGVPHCNRRWASCSCSLHRASAVPEPWLDSKDMKKSGLRSLLSSLGKQLKQ